MRLKKRFMKLDKDGSGSIDKDEFLQIPQIANNPLAHRMIAIFDEECVLIKRLCGYTDAAPFLCCRVRYI